MNPRNPEPETALSFAKERKFAQAEILLSKSLAFNSNNARALNLRGLISFEKRDLMSAIRDWRTSLSIERENNPARFYLGNCIASSSVLNTAREEFNNTIDALRSDSDLDFGITLLKRALSIDPGFIDAWKLLGLVRAELGEYGEAKKCWLEVLKRNCEDYDAIHYLDSLQVSFINKRIGNKRRFTSLFFSVAVLLSLIVLLVIYYRDRHMVQQERWDYMRQIEKHRHTIQQKSDEISALQKKIVGWNDRNAKLEAQYRSAIQQQDRLKVEYDDRINNLEKEKLNLKKENKSARAKIKFMENEIIKLKRADTLIRNETQSERTGE